MLSSLNPMGERARGQRWAVTVVSFTVGSLAGGALVGLVLGTIGLLVPVGANAVVAVLAAGSVAAITADLAGPTPPSLRRQVDRTWMTGFRGWVYGLGYGAQLGSGVTTYISSWTTWLMLVAMLLAPDPRAAVLFGIGHGLVRGLSVWTTARIHDPGALRGHHHRLHRVAPYVRATCHVAVATVTAVGVVVLVA